MDTALENKEGKLVSLDRDENRYVVKDWFSGRECSSFGRREILEAVENLARLHCLMVFPEEEKTYCGRPLKQELEGRTRELKKIRSFIRGREPKHPFEQMFLDSFPAFYSQAREAAALAEDAGRGGGTGPADRDRLRLPRRLYLPSRAVSGGGNRHYQFRPMQI